MEMLLDQKQIVEDSWRLKYEKYKGHIYYCMLTISEIIKITEWESFLFLAGD